MFFGFKLNISICRFPKDDNIRSQWLKILTKEFMNEAALRRIETDSNSRVCSKHFSDEAYKSLSNRRCLRSDAIPFFENPLKVGW